MSENILDMFLFVPSSLPQLHGAQTGLFAFTKWLQTCCGFECFVFTSSPSLPPIFFSDSDTCFVLLVYLPLVPLLPFLFYFSPQLLGQGSQITKLINTFFDCKGRLRQDPRNFLYKIERPSVLWHLTALSAS